MNTIAIDVGPEPKDSTLQKIRAHLRAFNEERTGALHKEVYALTARRDDGSFVGGMYGSLQWGWLVVDLAWVHIDERKQGIGRRLLQRFEELAQERGISAARLNTASFQDGLKFYKRCGYEIYAELEIFAPNGEKHVDYFLKKIFKA